MARIGSCICLYWNCVKIKSKHRFLDLCKLCYIFSDMEMFRSVWIELLCSLFCLVYLYQKRGWSSSVYRNLLKSGPCATKLNWSGMFAPALVSRNPLNFDSYEKTLRTPTSYACPLKWKSSPWSFPLFCPLVINFLNFFISTIVNQALDPCVTDEGRDKIKSISLC